MPSLLSPRNYPGKKGEGYGSTTTPDRDSGGGDDKAAHTTSQHQQGGTSSSAFPRNESVGGTTVQTTESEPLLGEHLLSVSPSPEERLTDRNNPKPFHSSSASDALSSIAKVGSDETELNSSTNTRHAKTTPRKSPTNNASNDEHMRTPTRSGSPRKGLQNNVSRGSLNYSSRGSLNSGTNSDPIIGQNVFTNNELDTLAYSRDPDESTLLTNDAFTKRYLLSSLDEEGNRRGLLWRIFHSKSNEEDPPYMLVCLGLAVGIALCSIAALAYVEYTHHAAILSNDNDNATTSTPETTWHGVPYTRIGRESFGDPVSNIIDISLFHPSLLYDQHATTSNKASLKPFLKVAFPTGAFWTNLVLLPLKKQQHQTKNNQFSYPIVAYPYSYQWSSHGKLQASYSAARRVIQATSIQDAFAPDITLGSVQSIHTRHVVQFDSLSVTLRFYAGSSSTDSNWETYIVQGSPYITAKYSGLAPELTALSDFVNIECPPTFQDESDASSEQPQHTRRMAATTTTTTTTATPGKKLGICAVATDSTKQKVVTGVQFVVTTKEGLTWLVFASEPITFEFNQAARRSIQSRQKYSGVIRVAIVPPPSATTTTTTKTAESTPTKSLDIKQLAASSGAKRLIYHAGAYPVGGQVSWSFFTGERHPLASSSSKSSTVANKGHMRTQQQHNDVHVRRKYRRKMATAEAPKENNIGRITFAFDTNHMSTTSPGTNVPLLMLALPHHAAYITKADKLLLHQDDFDLVYQSIKGRMVPIVGNTWSYEEELTFTGFGDESLLSKTNIAKQQSSTTSSIASTSATSQQRQKNHESTAISTLDQSVCDLLTNTVESDLKINLPVINNGAYGFGKSIARMAQLAHIADVVDAANNKKVDDIVKQIKNTNTTTKSSSSSSSSQTSSTDTGSAVAGGGGTARRGYALLEKYLTMWLVGDGKDKRLVYDAQLGGILSKEGMGDINADFGNARYNDHHFHYGYILYAAAILGRINPKFISQYGPFVDALFYDVAHNSANAKPNNDKEIFFPLARHKSWFDGHSFANGLFPFANGKSQESSSEAVNCYYGAYLWSRVRWGGNNGDRRMVDYARLLLATEITGAKTYWHMPPSRDSSSTSISGSSNTTISSTSKVDTLVPIAYNPIFRKNYMVGNLGMTDVTCTTWFGNDNIYVHLINFMPVTAMTTELFDNAYVKGERSVLSSNDSVENAWKGYSICNEAIVDPNNAWLEAQSLISTQLDPGLSKAQVLFWVSTREGFLSSTTVEAQQLPKSDVIGDHEEGESVLNSDSSGVIPEQQEASSSSSTNSNIPKPTNSGGVSSTTSLGRCSSHEKCVAEGLLGVCCPTHEGVFLHCCS